MMHLMATVSGILFIYLVSGAFYRPDRSEKKRGKKKVVADPFSTSALFWSYHDDNEDWKEDYPSCGGKNQSPISIYLKDTRYLRTNELIFSGYSTTASNLTMTNTGYTVTLELQKGLSLNGGGLQGMYIAHKMAFHWGSRDCFGSEHKFEGRRYPMEVQIYHYSSKFSSSRLALKKDYRPVVLAYFIESSHLENNAFYEIINNLKMINFKGTHYHVRNWNLDAFLPKNRSCFITYQGSITFPPCNEGVTWIILPETVHISEEQLEAFRTLLSEHNAGEPRILMGNNFRTLQPLNNRAVYRTCRSMSSVIALLPLPLRLLLLYQAGIVMVLQQ